MKRHPVYDPEHMTFDGIVLEKRGLPISRPAQFAMMGALQRILGKAQSFHDDRIEQMQSS